MNFYLTIALNVIYTIYLLIITSIKALIKFLIPYKYRCKNIKDEKVLITGSGSGLGRLVAKKLAQLGALCVLVDIDETANRKTANEILIEGGKAFTFKCDLSNRDEINKLTEDIKSKVGSIDILINNAGIVTGKKFLDSSDKAIEKTFQVNTLSHFWLTKAFLPDMLEKNHGHVVTVASMAGIFGTAGLCDYCASKYAAVGFDESLRMELLRLDKTGVKTTLVCPYYINTGMFDGVKSHLVPILEPDYVAEKIVEAILTNQKMLMLPRLMYFLYAFKGLLTHEVENFAAMDFIKTGLSMDEFKGRKTD
ncbi:unnamed protein product [Brachionus calyciflorus]|uniref:Epidermal retinol dehydrogenase 2 n=1 Tax=Brachionus calyciflorus TaxID=104777 RepID=A0A814IBN1_9BILA|nr:unnamed protein product [Brachionus calyciflorus]